MDPPTYTVSQSTTLCSTCARTIPPPPPQPLKKSTSASTFHQQPCCDRKVCGECVSKNPRLATYCCYHPISLPPSYAPPPTLQSTSSIPATATTTAAEAVTHHLRPHDTLLSLSFAYNIPLDVLRQHNRVFADSMLPGRRTVEIPAGYAAAAGGSLSGEEEEGVRRKREVKRFMLRTKCTDQLVAGVYLDLGGSVEGAVERWWGDGEWVKKEGKKRGAW